MAPKPWPPAADRSPLLESYSLPGSGLRRFEVRAMGTLHALLLAREGHDDDELARAAHGAFQMLAGLEERLSKFLPESEVSLLNSLGASRPVTISPDLIELLALSRKAWEITGGAFDPTIGPLMAAWGLVDLSGRVPPPEEIDALLERRGMDHVLVDAAHGTARFDRPGVALDLGGIGKGYAADAVASLLRSCGIESGAVLSGRSTIVVWGAPPGEPSWRVEVLDPRDQRAPLCRAAIEPGALSSSGQAERSFRRGSKLYGHVLDPRSGYPAETLEGVTVWTPAALLGDVLSTALFILGREALEPGGAAERLAAAFSAPGEPPRASILLVERDSGGWGGLRQEFVPIGEPGLRASP